jgi:methionyl-tRNA formyltransferase
MKNYLVATIHSWNIEAFHRYSERLTGNWHLITTSEELTLERVKQINPDYIFFPHWSWLVPNEIIDNWDCVCFHMTDVPFGRGGSPLQNLISRGINHTKISALKMTRVLDAGPVYLKRPFALEGSAEKIYENVALMIPSMIEEIALSIPAPVEQTGNIVYFERRTPEQSEIPTNIATADLYNFIRMLDAPSYPKAFIKQGDNKIEFSDAKLESGTLHAKVTITNITSSKQAELHSQNKDKS